MATIIEPRVLAISKTKSSITIDGVLDEAVWQNSEVATNFWQSYPYDSSFSELNTEVMVTYDDKSVYLGVTCHTTHQKNFVIKGCPW